MAERRALATPGLRSLRLGSACTRKPTSGPRSRSRPAIGGFRILRGLVPHSRCAGADFAGTRSGAARRPFAAALDDLPARAALDVRAHPEQAPARVAPRARIGSGAPAEAITVGCGSLTRQSVKDAPDALARCSVCCSPMSATADREAAPPGGASWEHERRARLDLLDPIVRPAANLPGSPLSPPSRRQAARATRQPLRWSSRAQVPACPVPTRPSKRTP